jgi:uncharacterized membrane protein YjfL (UPF0719 family)
MRTFSACTLRVTISPVHSLPDFLKVATVAMVVLLAHWFRARTIAASMAIGEAVSSNRLTGIVQGENGGAEHPS